MKYLHTMVRVSDLEQSLDFYCNSLGMIEVARKDSEEGRFTLVFLAAPEDANEQSASVDKSLIQTASDFTMPLIELTYNWDESHYEGGRNFGHLAFSVADIYQTCEKLMQNGVLINRPPTDGRMAFVKSPDGISIEILQQGQAKPIQEPWASMEKTGSW